MSSLQLLIILELKRTLRVPTLFIVFCLFIGVTLFFYGFSSKGETDVHLLCQFLLLTLMVGGYFQSHTFMTTLVQSGRLFDIVLSSTPIEWVISLLMGVELVIILLAFCLNLLGLYGLQIITLEDFKNLLLATPLAVMGVMSVSQMIASILSRATSLSYIGIILSVPLQIPPVVFYLGFMEQETPTSYLILSAIALFLFSLSLVVVPRMLTERM